MQKNCLGPALAGLLITVSTITAQAQYADAVIDYQEGTGFASGYTNAGAALGAPASGSGITPFSPPFQKTQIVSVGAGGSLTLHLGAPIVHNASNPFGTDFLIFGNSFFVITNGNFSGGGITDGTIFGNAAGSARVEVSADGANWFTLNPALAPPVDGLYPTDGTGNPLSPVNPGLTGANFAGLGLSGIESLYSGSAGGTGFNLAWAQDAAGNAVTLSSADFVRIDVLSGKAQIDSIAVVPEPCAGVMVIMAACWAWRNAGTLKHHANRS